MPRFFSLPNLALILALACLLVLGYRLSPGLSTPVDVEVTVPAECDLNRAACAVALPGGGRIELDLSPHPVPVAKPLQASAAVNGLAAEGAHIELRGVSMDMGLIQAKLEHAGNGVFSGETMIPVCISGRMRWRATFIIEGNRQRIAVPFEFDAPS